MRRKDLIDQYNDMVAVDEEMMEFFGICDHGNKKGDCKSCES